MKELRQGKLNSVSTFFACQKVYSVLTEAQMVEQLSRKPTVVSSNFYTSVDHFEKMLLWT